MSEGRGLENISIPGRAGRPELHVIHDRQPDARTGEGNQTMSDEITPAMWVYVLLFILAVIGIGGFALARA